MFKLNTKNEGDITQLVECMLCKHKVIGSNPIISIFRSFGGMVDTSDLKFDSFESIGSSPVTSILFVLNIKSNTKMMELVDMLGLGSSSF